jgi:hypothetical protein
MTTTKLAASKGFDAGSIARQHGVGNNAWRVREAGDVRRHYERHTPRLHCSIFSLPYKERLCRRALPLPIRHPNHCLKSGS